MKTAKKVVATTLKYGKYAGESFAAMPTEYLEHIVEESNKTIPAIKAELKKRKTLPPFSGAVAMYPKDKEATSNV